MEKKWNHKIRSIHHEGRQNRKTYVQRYCTNRTKKQDDGFAGNAIVYAENPNESLKILEIRSSARSHKHTR